jgi:hypothetical protein
MQSEQQIAGLKINSRTGLYEISEDRITYIFDFDMMVNLQSYLAEADTKECRSLINCWYKNLPLRKRLNIFVLLQDFKGNHQKEIL